MPKDTLEARILAFAQDPARGDFESLALELFERQFATLPEYREHCESLGATPAAVRSWIEIPAIPPPSKPEAAAEAPRGGLGSAAAELAPQIFRLALPELFDPSPLGLIVGPCAASSGATLLVEALGRDATPGSLIALARLDAKKLRSWLGARQRDRKPVSVISDLEGFERLVDVLERRAVKFRLPPGSEAYCALSLEATTQDAPRTWSEPLLGGLGLAPETCRRLLTGSGASTPLLELTTAPTSRFRIPHWVRLARVPGSAGSADGPLALFDLASLDTPPRQLDAGSALQLV